PGDAARARQAGDRGVGSCEPFCLRPGDSRRDVLLAGGALMKRIRSQKGAALLEAAITIPVILLICVGIFEFGRAYQTWQVLTNAAREGARLAVITGSTDADVTTRVRNYMQAGNLPNYGTAKVTIQRSVPLT